MRISPEWLADAPNAAPEELATACNLRIWVGDTNVATHFDGWEQTVEDHVSISAYSLADGLARDWWTIFGRRDDDYALIRHRMGYAVPDVRFRFDGVAFEVSAPQRLYENPNIRFWSAPDEIVDRATAESCIADFISETTAQLSRRGILRTATQLRWDRVQTSRADEGEAEFCEAAGALGLDPYSIDERSAGFIEEASTLFENEPLVEFLAAFRNVPLRSETLSWVHDAEADHSYRSRMPELEAVAVAAERQAPPIQSERGWALGYRRARAARAVLNMRLEDRIRSVQSLAVRFGAKSFAFAPHVNGLRALVARHDDGIHIHLRDRPASREARSRQLFAFGRAIGDAICFRESRLSVINELHDAVRQAASRAFAAEFLAPIDEIRAMRGEGRDIASIEDEFGVSSEVIHRQLENSDRIKSVCG